MKYIPVLFIILVAAIVTAGCTSFLGTHTQQSVRTDTTPTATVPSMGMPQASPSPISAPATHPFDPGKAQWVEYKVTDAGSTSDVRLEYSDKNVNGGSYKSVKRTVSYSGTGSDGDYSYDPGTNTLNFKSTGSSSSSATGIEAAIDQMRAQDPVMASGDLSYAPEGRESITVPKGSYECNKYAASFNGADATYWAADGVPVPLRIDYENKIMELVDWG